MGEWKEYKLTEVADFKTGKLNSNAAVKNGLYPFFTCSPETLSIDEFAFDTKAILLAGNNAEGNFAIKYYDGKFNAYQRTYVITGKNNKVADLKYLFYSIKSQLQEFKNISIGSATRFLTMQIFDGFILNLPPFTEQKSIASILSSLDDKIDLLHRQNATLEKLAETLFRQWFVEEAKEDWDEGTLDDILTVKGGATPSTSEPTYWNGNIHWTSPKDITNLNGIYLFDTERKITELGLSKISSGLLPKGTLLMSSRAPVGVLAFCEVPVAINQGYIAILDNKGYSKEFIYLWLKANMDVVHSFSNGSTFMEISKSAFKTLQLQIPPKQVTQDFQLIVEPLFNKIKSNNIQIRTLTALRDTLLPKLISGEVRVEV